jgi:hypothetical protein
MTDEEQHIAVVLRDLERGWNRCELEVFDEYSSVLGLAIA